MLICAAAFYAANVHAQTGNETPPPAESGTQTADDKPGAKVTISLDDAVIGTRLPFDVPFFFAGTPPADVTAIDMFAYAARRKAEITKAATGMRAAGTCESPGESFRPAARSAWSGTEKSSKFEMLVDALEPQRYYLFCFVLRGPVPAAEILPQARGIFATVMPAFAGQGATEAADVTLAAAQAVQERLADEIQRIGAKRPIRAVIPENNLFDPKRRVTRGDEFVQLLDRLITPYQLAERRAGDYETLRTQLQGQVSDAALGSAAKFVSAQTVADLRRAAGRPLTGRDAAFKDSAPFDFAQFDYGSLVESLTEAQEAATEAGDTKAEAIIRTIARDTGTLQRRAAAYGRQYDNLRLAVAAALEHVALESRQIRVPLGSTVLSADLARNAYVSLDAGVAYSWELESMVFYAGSNIYFRPINKNAPLREKGSFFRRFALTVGVTTTVKDDRRRASDLRPTAEANGTSNSLLLGGGLRVTPSIRIGAGALLFKESDPNPLITQTSVAATPYVALALDVNLGSALKAIFPNQ